MCKWCDGDAEELKYAEVYAEPQEVSEVQAELARQRDERLAEEAFKMFAEWYEEITGGDV